MEVGGALFADDDPEEHAAPTSAANMTATSPIDRVPRMANYAMREPVRIVYEANVATVIAVSSVPR